MNYLELTYYFESLKREHLSPRLISDISELPQKVALLEESFRSYITKQMYDGASEFEVFTIYRNLVHTFGEYVLLSMITAMENCICAKYVYNDEFSKYALTIIKFDQSGRFLDTLARMLNKGVSHNRIIKKLQEISQFASIDYLELLTLIVETYSGNKPVIADLLTEGLEIEKRRDLLMLQLRNNNLVNFCDLQWLLGQDDLADYIRYDFSKVGDNEKLISLVRDSKIFFKFHPKISELINLIFSSSKYLPLTVDQLFEAAVTKKDYVFLIEMGSIYNKKKILKEIAKQGDQVYIDLFFAKYAESPEIKSLAPFI